MIYFLDTSAVSHLVREDPSTIARISALNEFDRIVINTIVRGEILFGVHRLPSGSRREMLQQKVNAVLESLVCEPLTPPVAEDYAALKRDQQSKGLGLDENDLWIAASARFHRATLVTRDRDFETIDGIAIERWTA